MPPFVKLCGAPLSFRFASVGLRLCQTQSVKLIHPQRPQSAWYIQYFVAMHNRRSQGEIKTDITFIWEVNLVLRGLFFPAWNAHHQSYRDKCKCRMTSVRQITGMVNKSHVHAIVMNKNLIVFCASLIYLNTFKFLALYIVEIIMEGVYSVIILKKPIVKCLVILLIKKSCNQIA